MPDDDVQTIVEIAPERAARLRDAQQAYDEVALYLEDLKAEIKADFADVEGKVVGRCGDEDIYTYTSVESSRLDGSRLRREYPDIHAQYVKTLRTQRVSIARPAVAS